MQIIWKIFLLIIVSCNAIVNCNDIVRKQIWEEFYGMLPTSYESPISSKTDHQSSILLGVKIQNVDFSKTANGLICHATILLQVTWPVQNGNVFHSKLFRHANSLLLDEKKTWIPRIEFENSRNIKLFASQLELRKSKTKKQIKANFILTRSMNVQVLCESTSVYYPFSTVFCPLHLKQGGIANTIIRWKEQDGCIATDEVSKKTSCVNIDKKYLKILGILDYKNYLRVGICWHEGDYLARIFLPSSLIMLIAFVSLWNKSSKIQAVCLCASLCGLLILWFSNQLGKFSIITSIDIWFLLCFITVSLALCLLLLMRNANPKPIDIERENQIKDIVFDSPESPRCINPNIDHYDTHTTGKEYSIRYHSPYRPTRKIKNKSEQRWVVAKVLLLIVFIIATTLYWIIFLVMTAAPVECSENSRCKYAN